ncbi:MAG: GNAT family N-acetyltransferase [Oscillochloris sp.]|nr:GNAT family N-acetyltransferase [Oscillochloris sp.]
MRILRKISEEFWWDVAHKCSYATFYHTPIWKELAKRAFPDDYHDETFGAILPSGVHVVFPLVSKRRCGPIRWLESTFAGCYGGFIADGPVLPSEAVQLYREACTWTTYSFYVLENPLGPPLPEELTTQFNLIVSEIAYAIDLDADFDTIFARFSRSRRTAYRSGIKKGVKIRLAISLDEYRAYFHNYRDAVDRWGEDESYGYQWDLFEQIYQLSQIYPEQIKLWLIIINEQIVGGRLFVYWNQQASLWNGTAHRDFLDYHAIPVADIEILRDALAQGYRYYDFNTSSLDEGVMVYKQRFGAVSFPVNAWYYENPLYRPIRHIHESLLHAQSPAISPGALRDENKPDVLVEA